MYTYSYTLVYLFITFNYSEQKEVTSSSVWISRYA
jgi:hypothetical protein